MDITDDGRIEVTSDYQLLLRGILPSDEAQYRCTLGNDLGTVRVVVNVSVGRFDGQLASLTLSMLCISLVNIMCHALGPRPMSDTLGLHTLMFDP